MKKSSYSTALPQIGEAETRGPVPADAELRQDATDVLNCPPDLVTAFTDNMAVGKHQPKEEKEPNTSYKGGIDTLHLSLSIEWNERFELETFALLKQCQVAAKSGLEANQYFRIGDQVFRVFANGAGRGKGVFRHFIVEGSGIHFEFSTYSAPGDDYFNAVATLGSVTCNSVPIQTLWQRIALFFQCLGGRVLTNRVSRVDLYVDAVDLPLSWAMEAWTQDRVICRARSFSVYGDRKDAQTLKIGSGTFIRIYNKLAELHAKPDEIKTEQIAAKFGGTLPDVLTRFEFQCNRRFLRDLHVHSVQDLLTGLNSLGSYLTRNWFRITERKVDRNHTDRFTIANTWEAIAKTFEELGEHAVKNLVRSSKTVRNAPALIRQALGCMLKAVHGDVLSIAGFLKQSHETFRQAIRDLGNDEFYERLSRCHANGLTAKVDQGLSGPPKFVSAAGVLKRLHAFYGKQARDQETTSQSLFSPESPQRYVGECWPEESFDLGYPEEHVF